MHNFPADEVVSLDASAKVEFSITSAYTGNTIYFK